MIIGVVPARHGMCRAPALISKHGRSEVSGVAWGHGLNGEAPDVLVFGSILASTEEGRKELKFLSNCNPEQLERLCASL